MSRSVLMVALLFCGVAGAEVILTESPRTTALELKLGGYTPLVDRDLQGTPYQDTFGGNPMLLFELEGDRLLWQKLGAAGVGLSLGYAEKFGRARLADDPSQLASESTGLRVLPLKVLGVYRFDYAAQQWNVPLVPYLKAGFALTPWWVVKGGELEFADGRRGAGASWGFAGVGGLALLLDFFEPRLARDMDSTSGINHSYLFAEYVFQEVKFGGGMDLSSRHWMFGLTLEY